MKRWRSLTVLVRRLFVAMAAVAAVAMAVSGCTTSNADSHSTQARATVVQQDHAAATVSTPLRIAQVPAASLPPIAFATASGSNPTMYVELADTPDSQEIGLMRRPTLPDNQGMIFIFSRENLTPFWMKDTEIDLSIAFIDAGGVIVDIQEMQAYALDNHDPAKPYQYAIEANAHWYDRNGVMVGDRADVSQAVASSPVYGGATAAPTP